MDQRLAMRAVAERVLEGAMSPASAAAAKPDPEPPAGS
jgi:hypothetical protein